MCIKPIQLLIFNGEMEDAHSQMVLYLETCTARYSIEAKRSSVCAATLSHIRHNTRVNTTPYYIYGIGWQ